MRGILPDAEEALARMPDPGPDPADPSLRALYADIATTLRVPVVDPLFRRLAACPRFLQGAWDAMRHNLSTLRCEMQAARLRDRACLAFRAPGYADRVSLQAAGLSPHALDAIQAWNVTQQYALSKALLFAAAWDAALSGEAVGGRLPEDESPALMPRSVAEGARAVVLVDPAHAAPGVAATLSSLQAERGCPLLHDYYLGLARWPGYLERFRADARAAWAHGVYEAAADLWLTARAALPELPYVLPGGVDGVGRAQLPAIRSLLDLFARRLLPEVLLDVTLARSVMENPSAPRRSPLEFPISVSVDEERLGRALRLVAVSRAET